MTGTGILDCNGQEIHVGSWIRPGESNPDPDTETMRAMGLTVQVTKAVSSTCVETASGFWKSAIPVYMGQLYEVVDGPGKTQPMPDPDPNAYYRRPIRKTGRKKA